MKSLKLERKFSHAPSTVFDFVTQTENLVKWWGPENTKLGDHDLDLSRLGPWHFTLIDPEGNGHLVSGEVREIRPPEFVEFTLIVHQPDGSAMIDSTVQFRISSTSDGGSNFTLEQHGLTHDQMVKGSTQGWVSTLKRLEAHLNNF